MLGQESDSCHLAHSLPGLPQVRWSTFCLQLPLTGCPRTGQPGSEVAGCLDPGVPLRFQAWAEDVPPTTRPFEAPTRELLFPPLSTHRKITPIEHLCAYKAYQMHYQTKRRPPHLPTCQDFRPQGPQAAGSWFPVPSSLLPALSPVPGLCHLKWHCRILAPMVQEGAPRILDGHPQGPLVAALLNLEPGRTHGSDWCPGSEEGIHFQRSSPTCLRCLFRKSSMFVPFSPTRAVSVGDAWSR